jgi:hypothetical protein
VHTLAQSRQEILSYNSIQFWSGDNPVKASDCSDGQVRVVQQTEEGHSRSYAAVGVAEAESKGIGLSHNGALFQLLITASVRDRSFSLVGKVVFSF